MSKLNRTTFSRTVSGHMKPRFGPVKELQKKSERLTANRQRSLSVVWEEVRARTSGVPSMSSFKTKLVFPLITAPMAMRIGNSMTMD